jgi:hypothetical protein
MNFLLNSNMRAHCRSINGVGDSRIRGMAIAEMPTDTPLLADEKKMAIACAARREAGVMLDIAVVCVCLDQRSCEKSAQLRV